MRPRKRSGAAGYVLEQIKGGELINSVRRGRARSEPNRQIGEHLFLAEKTIKNYVSNVLAELGAERRTQAAILADPLLGR